MTRLHLIDGTFELYRAEFSKRPDHHTPEGRPFKAVSGMVASLLRLLDDPTEQVTHVAIAFDNPIRSFRNDLFDGYKSDDGVPPDLRSQFDAAEDACRALGIAVWSMNRFEADDAIATAAVRFAPQVDQVRVLSPDKDLGQILSGDRVVMVDRIRERVTDESAFRALRGIAPASMPDFLALVGDDADGIPGLEGFGEKSAAALLSRYAHLDKIPDDPALWEVRPRGADRLAATLASHREAATLYRRLATLVTDVPLPESIDQLAYTGVPRDLWGDWCVTHGLPRWVDRPRRWRQATAVT